MPTRVEHLALPRAAPDPRSLKKQRKRLFFFLEDDFAHTRKTANIAMSLEQLNGREGEVGIEDQLVSAAMQISNLRQQTKALNRALDSKDDEITRQER